MNLLSAEAITALAGVATGLGVSGVISWLLGRYDKRHPVTDMNKIVEKLDNLNAAVVELAYLRIRERHENAVRHGWLHPNEKHVLERLYAAYHSIGGNGTGTEMIEDIRRLPSVPPSVPPGGDTTSRMCDETEEEY
ncbi:hypothetical protein PG2049B_1290 [Bifidobacterium pseudolongum subsp. globosum]|uniref:Phage minor structural protein n=1 Tax=Bifidobacterium pseudolongum subsp. globosum TaxID=1690 RepID=A0A4Q5AK67_9BIFI|nr:hypothetical protein [Bifidobacterium pseudolongum]RYQ21406.1 hypothetical protein PG2049B_1290 [Bifidobacterium pseudolongum subsp. globosum]RYQ29972.1 hypothetical protein PG2017B_1255 [Bifidobacterium pseudolongum subsp. globosum]